MCASMRRSEVYTWDEKAALRSVQCLQTVEEVPDRQVVTVLLE